MGRVGDALRAGLQAMRDEAGPHRYAAAAGRPLRCVHCGGERLTGREVPLASRSAALANTEWLSDGAYAMTCAHCSCIQWFGARPQRLDP